MGCAPQTPTRLLRVRVPLSLLASPLLSSALMSNQDALKKELAAIAKRKENALCADCRYSQTHRGLGCESARRCRRVRSRHKRLITCFAAHRMPQPTWASFNLGQSTLGQHSLCSVRAERWCMQFSHACFSLPVLVCSGLFMCMNCAGHHRSLGTHISRVRSTTMDNWDAASVALMGSVGNVRANQFWENRLPPHQRINPTVPEGVRGDFIRAKYAQRAWYAAPEAGTVAAPTAAAATQEPQEAKQLSKMEQRQMRLAQQAQQSKAATPSPVSQPSVSVRQTSTPLPANNNRPAAAAAAAPQATLFSGMTPAAAPAPVVAAVPVKAAPLREHSASPWVSKSEFQQPQQQPQQQQFVPQQQQSYHQAPAAAASSAPVANLLDLSNVSDTPAVHPAPGHSVDDMFSGLSLVDHSASNVAAASHVHPHVNTAAGGAGAGSDLMSYYSNEPASAPARSQHPPQSSSASPDIFGGMAASSYYNNNAASSFSFIGGDSSNSGVGDDIGATASVADSSSAFSFLGGASADPPPPALDGSDFGALLAPAAAAAFPVPGMPQMMPFGAGGGSSSPPLATSHSFNGGSNVGFMGAAPLAQQQPTMQPSLSHSYSQPVDMFNPSQRPLQQSQPAPAQYGNSYGASNGGSNPLAALPPFGSTFGSSPAVPQFTVQSVQATAKAHAHAAAEIANDPFAHIEVLSPVGQQPQQAQGYGGGSMFPSASSPGAAPKQPHQCDVDGCEGKKVSRGLCSKHLRGGEAPMQQQQQQQQPAASSVDSSFSFLAARAPAALPSPSAAAASAASSAASVVSAASAAPAAAAPWFASQVDPSVQALLDSMVTGANVAAVQPPPQPQQDPRTPPNARVRERGAR